MARTPSEPPGETEWVRKTVRREGGRGYGFHRSGVSTVCTEERGEGPGVVNSLLRYDRTVHVLNEAVRAGLPHSDIATVKSSLGTTPVSREG